MAKDRSSSLRVVIFGQICDNEREIGESVLPLKPASYLAAMLIGAAVHGQVVTYEGNVFPEEEGWQRRPLDSPQGERTLQDGWFVQTVSLPDGWPGPTGDADFYRMSLAQFADATTLFIEWRAITNNPSQLLQLSAVPAVVSAAGNSDFYHTTITAGMVQLLRRAEIPLVLVGIDEQLAHTYRLEIRALNSFAWFVDGKQSDGGTPLASYPDSTSFLIWGVRRSYVDATTMWDYIRYGVIPQDGSGDYDSDGFASLDDFYFVHECLANDRPGIKGGPGNDAGPGCRFADFDSDGDTDLFDFAEFQNLFAGGEAREGRSE